MSSLCVSTVVVTTVYRCVGSGLTPQSPDPPSSLRHRLANTGPPALTPAPTLLLLPLVAFMGALGGGGGRDGEGESIAGLKEAWSPSASARPARARTLLTWDERDVSSNGTSEVEVKSWTIVTLKEP